MSELITQERIAVGSSNLVDRGGVDHATRHVWPLTKVNRSKVKVTRLRSVSATITL